MSKSTRRMRSRAFIVTLSVVTSAALIAVFALICVWKPLPGAVDSGSDNVNYSVDVGQTTLQTYCPARMRLADTGAYGDSAYHTSEGDIQGHGRYSAFGSMYDVSITNLDGNNAQDTDTIDLLDESKAFMHASDVAQDSLIETARMLDVAQGSGTAGAVMSSATQGDLRGVSASPCVTLRTRGALLLPSTQTGWTNQLVLANPSDKATTVTLSAHGTSDSGTVALSTGSQVTVDAHGETQVNLSAAAPSQDGLYVTYASESTQVAAVVRSVHMQGLTPLGSDYITSLADASRTADFAGVPGGADVSLTVYAAQDGNAEVVWLKSDGTEDAEAVTLTGGQVSTTSLGKAPDDAMGVEVRADGDIQAMLTCTDQGNGQSDFSVVAAAPAVAESALVLPDGATGEFALANVSDADVTVTLDGYDENGDHTDDHEVDIPAHGAADVSPDDIGDDTVGVVLTADGESVVWGAMIGAETVDDAHVAGLAHLVPTSLMPSQATVEPRRSTTVVD